MSASSSETGRLGAHAIVVLNDARRGRRVRIACRGASVLGMEMTLRGGESWQLQIPAASVIRTDAEVFPLAGTAAKVPLEQEPAHDFRHARAIGAQRLDHVYVDLQRDPDGRSRTRPRDPASGLGLAVRPESGVLLVFAADTVSRDVRRSMALEPMEGVADAFNRPDCADAIRLEPGAQRTFRWGVEIECP